MNEILRLIFEAYAVEKRWTDNDIDFYSAEDSDKTSFFLIDYVDVTGETISDTDLLKRLKKLERDYIDETVDGKGVKKKITELFGDKVSIAAQIDKNTSAIYPIKLDSLNNLDTYRNLIYSVEESP